MQTLLTRLIASPVALSDVGVCFVTLVVAVNGPESIWLLADRRLSYVGWPPKEPKDDARKIMFLETVDGVAILGYAGLGATKGGTEPADWMGAVLRGRNLPLEQSLGALAEAMKKQFPRHMVGLPAHNVIVPAFLGEEPRLYTIDLTVVPDRKSYAFRCTRVVHRPPPATSRTPRIGMAGSGGIYLIQQREKKWIRSLLRLVKANDRGQVSPQAVADHLANLNNEVHLGTRDESVACRCIVAWRHRKGSVHQGGGGQQFYTGTTRDSCSPCLPTIMRGMDVKALIAIEMPHMIKMFEARRAGQPAEEPNKEEINARLARLPDKPDENLR
jgi:hypothetical protein